MKIMIIGSMTFAKEMLKAKQELTHEVRIMQPTVLHGDMTKILL